MYTLAVANQKGGVAKTTTAANLADTAAERGLRVLLVDLDAQANATSLTEAVPQLSDPDRFGKTKPLTVSDALYAALDDVGGAEQPSTLLSVAVPAGEHWSPRLHVAPANQDLARRGTESFAGVERRLAIALAGCESDYDLVVVDCPPSLGTLFLSALTAADGVLLVTEPADNSLEGLPLAIDTVNRIRLGRGETGPELLGMVATNVPSRESRPRELLELLGEQYGEQLWGTVPRRSVVRQAEGAHAPLRAFGSDARDVTAVHDRVLDRLLEHVGLVVAVA